MKSVWFRRHLILSVLLFVMATQANAVVGLSYFKDEEAKANILFSQNISKWVLHETNIILAFEKNRKLIISDVEICKIAYNAYTSLAQLNKQLSIQDNIKYRESALAIVNDNALLANTSEVKESVIHCFVGLIGLLIENRQKEEAFLYNDKMVEFGRKYHSFELNSILFMACSMNSCMGEFSRNNPLYEELYKHFDNLDKREKYKVVQELIHSAFKDAHYERVIELAKLHTPIIESHNGDAKDSILDLIGFSYIESINSMLKEDKSYSSRVEMRYRNGYNWLKDYNPRMVPMLVINWGCCTYNNPSTKCQAIKKFYEYLDLIQNASKNSTIFSNQYANVEDAQNALISIIVTEVISSTPPKNLKSILTQYEKILRELFELETGGYFQTLKDAIEVGMKISHNS